MAPIPAIEPMGPIGPIGPIGGTPGIPVGIPGIPVMTGTLTTRPGGWAPDADPGSPCPPISVDAARSLATFSPGLGHAPVLVSFPVEPETPLGLTREPEDVRMCFPFFRAPCPFPALRTPPVSPPRDFPGLLLPLPAFLLLSSPSPWRGFAFPPSPASPWSLARCLSFASSGLSLSARADTLRMTSANESSPLPPRPSFSELGLTSGSGEMISGTITRRPDWRTCELRRRTSGSNPNTPSSLRHVGDPFALPLLSRFIVVGRDMRDVWGVTVWGECSRGLRGGAAVLFPVQKRKRKRFSKPICVWPANFAHTNPPHPHHILQIKT